MFWKKENKLYEKLLRQFELVSTEVKVLQKDIEIINIKLRKRVYKEPSSEEKGTTDKISTFDDGFDELRRLNK